RQQQRKCKRDSAKNFHGRTCQNCVYQTSTSTPPVPVELMQSPLPEVFFRPDQKLLPQVSPVLAASVATPVNCVLAEEQFAFAEAVFSRNHVATPAARERKAQT